MGDGKEKHAHGNHGWLMFLSCLVMVGALWYLVASGAGGGWVWLTILLCPLMHIFMMRGHSKQEGSNPEGKDEDQRWIWK